MTAPSLIDRRGLLATATLAAAGMALPAFPPEALAAGEGKEYVFLTLVTQVPFWIDHKLALADAEKALGIKTEFTGPLDFDTAGQARQLDELIARQPAGLLLFPGDVAALAPGIDRAIE